MSLIAHFVFDKGNPVDVRFSPSQKYEFIKSIENGRIFHDKEGGCIFYANLACVRLLHISTENINLPTDEDMYKIEDKCTQDK